MVVETPFKIFKNSFQSLISQVSRIINGRNCLRLLLLPLKIRRKIWIARIVRDKNNVHLENFYMKTAKSNYYSRASNFKHKIQW